MKTVSNQGSMSPAVDPENRGGAGGRRRRARVACLQAMYRAEVVGDSMDAVAGELAKDPKLPEEIRAYAARLIALVEAHAAEIDGALEAALERWELKRLAVLDRCVLRIGAAELFYEPELHTNIILSEAIEIAKRFGGNESGGFVNGVLDRVARDHRPPQE
jgi:transcription antitermination protein NusB